MCALCRCTRKPTMEQALYATVPSLPVKMRATTRLWLAVVVASSLAPASAASTTARADEGYREQQKQELAATLLDERSMIPRIEEVKLWLVGVQWVRVSLLRWLAGKGECFFVPLALQWCVAAIFV